ncbi:GNAT family N-acetyltransferase [Phenylobacterium deserti]|uniref:GNAT family N-acetyltransferase n=1 Tax=Phenylobacterium deserti TaxID=1914756 RepID=A0A328AUS5_9CAUL|nr:GNAT family N-acetyltransferase [Phenylobacterium deserti]RAK56678.1 GNAT family N-acetyltransferase [Phenylobacterium deserti]
MSAPHFVIRTYQAADAPRLAQLYFESARTIGARRYSPEQVAAWAPEPADPATVHARASDGRVTLVAEGADGTVLGYGDLEADGHIDHLYAHPAAAGTGVGSALLQALVEQARAWGATRLYVEASELARGLFERQGFTTSHRRDFEVRGVPIHNYAMERSLV